MAWDLIYSAYGYTENEDVSIHCNLYLSEC